MKYIATLALGLLMAANAQAQNNDKLVIKPSGRVLFDGAMYKANTDKELFNSGMAIPDARVGFSAKTGKWSAKVDVGYAYGKVGMKDVFIEHHFDTKNSLRAGYYIHQFGAQYSTSSSYKISMEEPRSNEVFNNPRMIGLMYVHNGNQFLGTASVFTESEAMKLSSDKIGNSAIGAMSRLVYRPYTQTGKILQVGVSGAYLSPRYNADEKLNHKSYVFSTAWPTRVAKVTALKATVTDAEALFKFTPELVAAYGRLGIETQYYYAAATRSNSLDTYHASGAYCSLRGIIKGNDYKYTSFSGGIDTPDAGSAEVVLAYDYTDLSDSKAGIFGGRSNDWSATFNYYINKNTIWRLRASYTKTENCAETKNNEMGIIETRLQFKF